MASSELIWECIKGGNSFMRKGLNNSFFSTEAGNLTSTHSYKHSGIANKKTVDLATDGNDIVLTKNRTKKTGKHSTTFKKTNQSRKIMKSVGKEVAGYRKDLANIATRRASSLAKSVRAAKASK
jgi:large subunit ribosomal protein L28e